MRLVQKDFWYESLARAAMRFGFVKIPTGVAASRGGLFGFSSLGSLRKQCEAYQGHVYKCVTLIYRRAIGVPMLLYKERGDTSEELKRHPFIDLMRRPNPFMTGRDLKAMTFMHRDLTGMAFWLKVMNRLGRPAELWPLPVANFVKFVFNDAGTDLLKYEFRTDRGEPVFYDPEEIVYFRYPHPLYLLDGASPIQAMAFAYDTDLAVRVYQRNFFQNSARPDVVFETDQSVEDADARRLLMAWKQAHQGVERSWEPAILDRGMKIKSLTTAAKDFEFAALAGWTKEDILEAYNVPAGKLGSVKDVNKANALGIDITFNSECIAPRLDSYEDQITLDILPHYDAGLFANHVNCVPRDREHDLKERESNLKIFFTTVNEEREKEGLDPVAWGDAPFVPINTVQYGDELKIQRGRGGERETPPFDSPLEGKLKGGVSIAKDARLRVGHERRVAARSRAFRIWLRKFFARQRAEVLANLEKYYERVNGAIAGMSLAKARGWLETHKDTVETISFDMTAANRELSEGGAIYIEGSVIAGAEEALALVESAVEFELYSPDAARFLRDAIINLRDVNRTTHDRIVRELSEGFEAGESMNDLARRIEKVFANADRARSLTIAQTETNKAVNFGAVDGYRQSGVVERKGWLAGDGARETHRYAARRYDEKGAIPIDQDFEVGGGRGPAPGSIGLAEEDIN